MPKPTPRAIAPPSADREAGKSDPSDPSEAGCLVRCGSVVFAGIRAIAFDKDGTLARSDAFLGALGRARADGLEAAVPGSGDRLLEALGVGNGRVDPAGRLAAGSRADNEAAAIACLRAAGVADGETARAIARQAFAEADARVAAGPAEKAECTPPYPDALPCLRSLAQAGLALALVTADTPAAARAFADRHAPRELAVALGSEGAIAKPAPQLLWAACAALNVPPSATLVVGDAASDAVMARRAGAAGCAIVDRGGQRKFARNFGADAIVSTLTALVV